MASTQKIRVNGQVVETSREELQNLASEQGLPAPPTSPGQAAGMGASPESAKMAGSPQQKQAAINVAVKPQQTLQTAKRVEGPRDETTAVEEADMQRAQTLQKLTKVDAGLQGLINQHLATMVAPVVPAFSEEQLKTLQADVDQNAVKDLLTKYRAATERAKTDPKASAEVATYLAELDNKYGIKPESVKSYFQADTAGTVVQAGAAAMTDEVTLGGLDLTQVGFTEAEIVDALGEDWAALTPDQLVQRVEDIRQQEFKRVDSLKAELASLSPGSAQREAIMRELQGLAQVGIYGAEARVADLAAQMDEAKSVVIAGEEFQISEILQDDQFSNIIARYLNPHEDDKWKATLEQEHPEFAKWMQDNVESLDAVVKQMELEEISFGTIQKGQAELQTKAGLNDTVMKAIVPDWGKAVTTVTDLSKNAVYQAATSDKSVANKLNGLEDPDVLAALGKLTKDEIADASAMADALEDDAIAYITGLDIGTKFVLDAKQRTIIDDLVPLVTQLRTNPEVEMYMTNPAFLKLLADGDLNDKNIDAFMKKPGVFKDYLDYTDRMDQIARLETDGDIQDAIDFLLGVDDTSPLRGQTTVDALNQSYQDLKLAFELDPNSPRGKQYMQLQATLDADTDGDIDAEDMPGLLERIKTTKVTKTFKDAISTGLPGDNSDATRATLLDVKAPTADSLETKLSVFGNKIDYADLETLNDEELSRLPASAWQKVPGGKAGFESYKFEREHIGRALSVAGVESGQLDTLIKLFDDRYFEKDGKQYVYNKDRYYKGTPEPLISPQQYAGLRWEADRLKDAANRETDPNKKKQLWTMQRKLAHATDAVADWANANGRRDFEDTRNNYYMQRK